MAAVSSLARGPMRRVRPSDPNWPGRPKWMRLKDEVGGNLLEPRSLFASCAADSNGSSCLDAHKNVSNPFWIGDQPAGTQVSGWLDAWSPAPSAYAVKARTAADVAAAVNFARDHKLRIVVKGTGHSYQGTSNAADSLLIWTRAMTDVTVHEAFVPKNCAGKVAPEPAVTAGAGAMSIDLYHAVTTVGGRYVQCGGCTDTGVAGLVQSGGFGSYSKGFGTAAAGLLEAEIVTADGVIRTVNACNEPDLFWAIKGGGGGSWGVLTKVTLRTHELPLLGGAYGRITAHSDEAYRKLIGHFIAFYVTDLFNPHWGEQVSFTPDNTLELSMSCQGLDERQVSDVWQPFLDWVASSSNDFSIAGRIHVTAKEGRGMWDAETNQNMNRDLREGAPKHHGWWHGDQDQVWAYIHGSDSLWLPASLLQGDRQRKLADALFAASRHHKVALHINKGLAGSSPEIIAAVKETAMNPAVTDAFALAMIGDGEAGSNGPSHAPADMAAARRNAQTIAEAAAELYKIVPNAGSYVSESNYFNKDWQHAFWGANYRRLQTVKAKYDPDGLFIVHHGVGSEDWSSDGFTRFT